MAKDFSELGNIIDNIKKDVNAGVSRKLRATALLIDQKVVYSTPVKTGRARANWLAAVDAEVITPTDDTDKEGNESIAKAGNVIGTFDPLKNATIFITNNVAYIGFLNEGSSVQAPANFVQIAVAQGQAEAARLKILKG